MFCIAPEAVSICDVMITNILWPRCIALYRFSDITKISTMVFTERTGLEKLYAVMAYAIDRKRCRRTILAEHFGEDFESQNCNSMCDNCSTTESKNTGTLSNRFLSEYRFVLKRS